VHALRRAIKLFVYAWNRHQLYKRQSPPMPEISRILDFIHSLKTRQRPGAYSGGTDPAALVEARGVFWKIS